MTLQPFHLLASVVMRKTPAFYRTMRDSLWLYVALVLLADEDGVTRRSFKEISDLTGIREATLKSWSGHLRKAGLLRISRTTTTRGTTSDRDTVNVFEFYIYGLLKPERGNRALKARVQEAERGESTTGASSSRPQAAGSAIPDREQGGEEPDPANRAMAEALLQGLGDDEDNLDHYIALCEELPAPAIQRAYDHARRVPQEKIKKSRGALFTFLAKKYAQNEQ